MNFFQTTETAIGVIEKMNYNSTTSIMEFNICCICSEDFQQRDNIVIVKHTNDKTLDDSKKRGHYFHQECLQRWREHHPICPLDRDPISKVYNIPDYQLLGLELGLYDYDYKNVILDIKLNDDILDQFSDINEIDKNNKTLAFYACKLGNFPLVAKLLKRNANFNQPCGHANFTPLMVAICYGHIRLVNRLLASKKVTSNLHVYDKTGNTAFGYACKYCCFSIIKTFIDRKLVTKHQVRYYLDENRDLFNNDIYGKDIISIMCYYLKSDI